MKTVILTDENGQSGQPCEILEAHTNGGKLHKAFSIFVYNEDSTKMLIQKRADSKLLWANFWSNTCCSHPKEERSLEQEAQTRLQEECGFTCDLRAIESFVYQADDPNGNGTEYEYDTILVGHCSEDTKLQLHPEEASDAKWISLEDLTTEIETNPEQFTPWFLEGLHILSTHTDI